MNNKHISIKEMGVKNNLSTNGFYKRMFHNMHTTFDDHHQIRKRADVA
jgi:hypothetical protein